MKTRFSTLDLVAVLHDLKTMVGLRVQNVYDIDSKTYLIKLHKPDHKATILFESGIRIHPTEFDWPKSPSPSGFSMKLRKHIRQKRLEACSQLGVDRIVDLQFGSEQYACHVIIELYDRGNVVLTDHEYTILNLLRRRTDKDTDVKYAVRENYKPELARQNTAVLSREEIQNMLAKAKPGDNLRRVLVPATIYGPALIEHCSQRQGWTANAQIGKQIDPEAEADLDRLEALLNEAQTIFDQHRNEPCVGILTLKCEKRTNPLSGEAETLETYQEFHPYQFAQHQQTETKQFDTFGKAVDEFFSKREAQKIDMKALHQEKDAIKKLDNIKKDHQKRLAALQEAQQGDERRAELIQSNKELVGKAILVLRSAVANKLDWEAIQEMIEQATDKGDPIASRIKTLKLGTNQFTMLLSDPYDTFSDSEEDDSTDEVSSRMLVDIDLNLGAYQNAARYFGHKKQAKVKEQKTVDASKKALKSAEVKTHEALKQVHVRTTVIKQRKTYWFEKFLWFVSSDNYLVLGGRDAQQNELLVKRYFRPGDVYVHADLRGASSVIVQNRAGQTAEQLPPRTLTEAATLAVCNSAAWDAKVVAGAWWVKHDQVTRTAPTGEYLTAGSFMIRGKKNFVPTVQLQMGFGYLFRLDDECIERHKGERTPNVTKVEEIEEETEELELSEEEEEGGEAEAKDDEFPDVQVKLERLNSAQDGDVTIVQLGPKVIPRKQYKTEPETVEKEEKITTGGDGQPKRGQKHKNKKAKQKYANQDEEERMLRMQLLASAGQKKPDKKALKKAAKKGRPNFQPKMPQPETNSVKEETKEAEEEKQPENGAAIEPAAADQVQNVDGAEETMGENNIEETNEIPEKLEKEAEPEREEEEEEEDDAANELQSESTAALDALTAKPYEDDVLLFALPVCAPYSTMNDYKFKVKLTPGPGKRGKATKTALQIFLKDRSALQREKDLIKATQDNNLGINLPGKVKVSAPQLMAIKQKQKHK